MPRPGSITVFGLNPDLSSEESRKFRGTEIVRVPQFDDRLLDEIFQVALEWFRCLRRPAKRGDTPKKPDGSTSIFLSGFSPGLLNPNAQIRAFT
jgi:hypothetical protein